MRRITDKIYPHIIPDLKQWPIYQFALHKAEYKKELVEIVFNDLIKKYGDDIKDEISKCAYLELKRIKLQPWKVDPPEEQKFWLAIRKELLESDACDDKEYCYFQLKRIINRYIEEIFGDFKISTFKLARVVLAYFFNRLFNGFFTGMIFNPHKHKSLKDKILLAGYIEEVRDLFKKGVVIFLPTHQSNLDSIMLGFTIDYKLGLPAFAYGAGLNLFNYEIAAYYMSRLGAYKVDRRKKNSIYFNTLLNYSKYSILKGVNTIFFPGGTRSRSGKIETELKTGLMSSLVDAQYEMLNLSEKRKIFVVPVIMNYHSVLEAKPLIYSFLKKKGKKKFLPKARYRDKIFKLMGTLKLIYRIFTKKSSFVLSLGKPMDVMGNAVDAQGNSIANTGAIVKVEDYYKREGELVYDAQRNLVYTKMLAKKVAKSYLRYNVVFCSHLVAYSAFKAFMEKLEANTVFDLMKYQEKNQSIEFDDMKAHVEKTLAVLLQREKEGKIILTDELKLETEEVIKRGIKKLGVFHDVDVLYKDKKNNIKTGDFGLLYYYANRLSFLDK